MGVFSEIMVVCDYDYPLYIHVNFRVCVVTHFGVVISLFGSLSVQ